jgi:hypothetical protein
VTFSSGPDADHRVIRETSWLTCLPGPTSASFITRPRTFCAPLSAAAPMRSRGSARSPAGSSCPRRNWLGLPSELPGTGAAAKALIDAGADIDAISAPDSGGVPSGTALAHAAGTPVNEADAEWERLPLHTAAGSGRAASVRQLLAHSADPNLRDPRHHRTALEECQPPRSPGHREVEAILRPLTRDGGTRLPQAAGS